MKQFLLGAGAMYAAQKTGLLKKVGLGGIKVTKDVQYISDIAELIGGTPNLKLSEPDRVFITTEGTAKSLEISAALKKRGFKDILFSGSKGQFTRMYVSPKRTK